MKKLSLLPNKEGFEFIAILNDVSKVKTTVRDIFCKGADWYKYQCQKGNVC